MRITLDAGALCSNPEGQFGTYTFTHNILMAFNLSRNKHTYIAYGFCKKPYVWDMKHIKYRRLQPSQAWMSVRVPIEELLIKPHIYMGLSQASPLMTPARIFTFLHGLSFLKYPQYYPDSHIKLKKQLMDALTKSEQIFVSSERVKEELAKVGRHQNVQVIPFGIPHDMQKVIQVERRKQFIFVGMNHPIKRVKFIVDAFMTFRSNRKYKDYELLLVGDFKNYEQKGIVSIEYANRTDLQKLYAQSQAYLSASYYESYNFPILEALSQGCEVVATSTAVIPEMRQFTHIADTKEEFVQRLIKVANRRSSKNIQSQLRKDFSWNKTIKIITSYY